MSFTRDTTTSHTGETRYTLTGPLGSLVLVSHYGFGFGGDAFLDAPPRLELWIHRRTGQGSPDQTYCPVLAAAGHVGPCWTDVLAGRATQPYTAVIGDEAALFQALKQEYYLSVEQDIRR